jgi:hypothetical protein
MSSHAQNSRETNVEEKPKPGKARRVVNFVLSQWLTFGFGVACLLAHFFPCT